ncbi:hypothetical protein EVAR_26837_1 [Eumeta japonica]|uniref:Uncharacterized protein n=1 Tax=Eumeta variegata TaxID=151549 RepID=A0A4C1VXU2_EUMVA|nr:hypothetical protein EVAR_26837_1 [Eumeta japonica]
MIMIMTLVTLSLDPPLRVYQLIGYCTPYSSRSVRLLVITASSYSAPASRSNHSRPNDDFINLNRNLKPLRRASTRSAAAGACAARSETEKLVNENDRAISAALSSPRRSRLGAELNLKHKELCSVNITYAGNTRRAPNDLRPTEA